MILLLNILKYTLFLIPLIFISICLLCSGTTRAIVTNKIWFFEEQIESILNLWRPIR